MTDFKNELRESLPEVDKPKRTICEVHREIYDRLDELGLTSDAIVPLLEEAYALGKKMDAKLRQHDLKKGPDWYAKERERVLTETLAARRERRIARQKQRIADEAAARKARPKGLPG